jgi:anti-sigma regulatory factor (Ser/Thr protein kinase)
VSCATVIPVSDRSRIGEARRVAVQQSVIAKFTSTDQGRVAIVATELATNLLNHAKNGQFVVQVVPTSIGLAVEILSIDSGPGIANVERSLRDGFSTGGTSGNGLGAVRRLSDEFDIYSQPERGTILFASLLGRANSTPDSIAESHKTSNRLPGRYGVVWSGISIPIRGEEVCGDTWLALGDEDQLAIMVADGLGHGPLAAEASVKAVAALAAEPAAIPGTILRKAHQALAGTRGAAVAMARVHLSDGVLKYAGIGNISGSLFCGMDERGLSSQNGIVGVQMRSIREFDYPILCPGMLVMHSDGLQSRWGFDDYPGLRLRHPMVMIGVLLRDFARGRDDVTIVIARWDSVKAQTS